MTFVGGRYKNDVFISYAHGDQALTEWSFSVKTMLEQSLRFLFADRGRALSVFIDDTSLSLNQPLTQELREQAQSSAAMVIVMSGQYLKSPWCRDEGSWFVDMARTAAERRGLFFVVRAQETKEAEWPPYLRDERGFGLPGYPFYDVVQKQALPWGWLGAEQNKLGQAVGKLARQLAGYLLEVQTREQTAVADPVLPGDGPRVLLGFATEDLEDERNALAASLRAAGLGVVAPEWPAEVDDIRDLATKAAEGCAGLVQLCGNASGRWRHDPDGFVAYQIRLFEASRRPRWLVRAGSLNLDRLKPAAYADIVLARRDELVDVADPAAILSVLRPSPLKASAPAAPLACSVFLQSRIEYRQEEEHLRAALNGVTSVEAHILPAPPIWALANAGQISGLLDMRRRLAANLDAQLLMVTDRPELLTEDMLDYVREQRMAGMIRLPAAIVDTTGRVDPQELGVRLPVFQLGAPDFGARIGAWLHDCASRPRLP